MLALAACLAVSNICHCPSLPRLLRGALPLLPQTFLNLECPAVQVLLHINASQAAPRLAAPALHAALEAARGSAEGAQEQLRRVYSMPRLDLGSNDTMMQLLGEVRAGQEKGKTGSRRTGLCTCLEMGRLEQRPARGAWRAGVEPGLLDAARPQARSRWRCRRGRGVCALW